MSTTHNACTIEDQLSEAASHLSDAIENMKKAIAAVSTENNAGFKAPELESIKGLLEVGFRSTESATREWHKVAVTRANAALQQRQ